MLPFTVSVPDVGLVGFWAQSRRDRDPEAQEPRLNPFQHAGPDELPKCGWGEEKRKGYELVRSCIRMLLLGSNNGMSSSPSMAAIGFSCGPSDPTGTGKALGPRDTPKCTSRVPLGEALASCQPQETRKPPRQYRYRYEYKYEYRYGLGAPGKKLFEYFSIT
jgi:hypothetical protein